MKTCYIYVRVSTDKQADTGYSIDAQKKTCRELAHRDGYAVLEVFSDEGESATAVDRPGFQNLLNRCENKPVDAIIVWQTDRFARNEVDHFLTKDRLNKLGIRLISAAQPMIDDSPGGLAMDGMMAVWNAYFSRDLSRKTKKGLMQKWEEKCWPGWAPLGYKNVGETKKRREIIIDKLVAPFVINAFKLYATGNHSVLSLQRKLHRMGLRSRNGKALQCSTLNNIVRNPFYYGFMRWNGMEQMGKHKPLITKEIFDRCQYIAAKKRNFLVRKRKYNFLLRGFVYCVNDTLRYVAEWHPVKSKLREKIGYYHCSKRGGCHSPNAEINDLEIQVIEEVKKLEFSPTFIELVRQKIKDVYNRLIHDISHQKQQLINQKTGLEIKRGNLEERIMDGTIDRETYTRLHDKVQARVVEVDTALVKMEQQRKIDVNFIDEVLAFTRNIHQAYLDAPTNLKRHYLRFFFEKFWVKDKRIVKVDYSPFFLTLQENNQVILRSNWLPRLDSNQRHPRYK